MTDAAAPPEAPPKKSKKPLIFGLILALLLGGGGFYTGLILGASEHAAAATESADPLPDIAFVAVEPLVISLGDAASERFLRFTSQLEVNAPMVGEISPTPTMPPCGDGSTHCRMLHRSKPGSPRTSGQIVPTDGSMPW